MKSLWNDCDANSIGDDLLAQRVYTSRLLGQDSSLVLHGGGNTSVKIDVENIFGEVEEILYVKGSGWDLETIEKEGFAPVRMETLKKMVELEELSDSDMVKIQRSAMINPSAPNPSVEAILHAIIPFTFVDHTHTDAMITVSNTPEGEEYIREIYGDRVLVVPYVMPGFILAKEIYQRSEDLDWSTLEGMVLMNHGLFTFADSAQESYERMIKLVSEAEEFIQNKEAWNSPKRSLPKEEIALENIAQLRSEVSKTLCAPVLIKMTSDERSCGFASRSDVGVIGTRGPLTPDHVIRTKPYPLILDSDTVESSVNEYVKDYENYFRRYDDGTYTCLDRAPRWGVWKNYGTFAIGTSVKNTNIISDIVEHTVDSIQRAESLGGWVALEERDIFEMEYWELEQAKLGKNKKSLPLQGKVAWVTGAANGIGKASVEALVTQGASVVALDIQDEILTVYSNPSILSIKCDITKESDLKKALKKTVLTFGGIDILVNNAGIFPKSCKIEDMDSEIWDKSLAINLTAQQRILQMLIPFLKRGVDPAVVFIASKNVPAPGPGQAAYSVAKAGLTQLLRVAALELGAYGIRVNALHPNAVFDTALWTDKVLQSRAQSYNMTVEEYKSNNVLKKEVTSHDVAKLVVAMVNDTFGKTTGAQVAIDGGNERVI